MVMSDPLGRELGEGVRGSADTEERAEKGRPFVTCGHPILWVWSGDADIQGVFPWANHDPWPEVALRHKDWWS
jgi:hypothetical protein